MKNPLKLIIPPAVLTVLLCAALYFSYLFQSWLLIVSLAALGAALILYVALACVIVSRMKRQQLLMDAVFRDNAGATARIIKEVSVPCALITPEGRIVWRNDTYARLYDEDDITAIMPLYHAAAPQTAVPLEYAGGAYQVMNMPLERPSRPLTFQYWLDRTEAAHYQRLFEEQMPYVALVYVDNYEELASDLQFQRTSVLAEVERQLSDTVRAIEGIYRRYENGRFLIVFEAKRLRTLEEERFALLEAVRKIDTGTGTNVSLSIAVGVADRIALSDESARQAMELALGRGGDQAVIKAGTNYRFYGGKRQLESMQSRVKTRLFSKALRQLFENAGDVFIVGHKHADMDCIGAALGVAVCARHIGSRAYIVLDEDNASIDRAISLMRENRAYDGMLISPDLAERMMRPSSVLVIVDTQRPSTVIAPRLIGMASRLVLIDHHRRSADHIENPTLHYLESRASSSSELVTEVIQYFDDNLRPPAFVCGTLLAGITVDTKHFAFNVGSRTFEAAGYLRRNGADISMVKQLFQDDMESYGDCANTVRSAEVLPGGIAVASVGENVKNAKLIAAKAADELIGIRGIEAAFVLGREDGAISLSGRSLGNINVQVVCEKLGGGGHLTMAGAQLGDLDMEEASAMTRAAINEYEQEVGTK
ncbi:MAG: DHH family phosphoesterase [Clostridia bacterium]|nr:DHH family phosphoesterase [Clostridia bacterium]